MLIFPFVTTVFRTNWFFFNFFFLARLFNSPPQPIPSSHTPTRHNSPWHLISLSCHYLSVRSFVSVHPVSSTVRYFFPQFLPSGYFCFYVLFSSFLPFEHSLALPPFVVFCIVCAFKWFFIISPLTQFISCAHISYSYRDTKMSSSFVVRSQFRRRFWGLRFSCNFSFGFYFFFLKRISLPILFAVLFYAPQFQKQNWWSYDKFT